MDTKGTVVIGTEHNEGKTLAETKQQDAAQTAFSVPREKSCGMLKKIKSEKEMEYGHSVMHIYANACKTR